MKKAFALLVLVLMVFLFACKKDEAPPAPEPQLGVLDTVPHYPIELSSVWQYEHNWSDGAPQPFNETHYRDTITYYFTIDTVMTRSTWISQEMQTAPETATYYRVNALTNRHYWVSPNNPNYTPDGQIQSDELVMYIKFDVENAQVFMAEYSDFSNSLYDYDFLLYDFGTPAGQEIPHTRWTASANYHVEQLTTMTIGSTHLRKFSLSSTSGGVISEYIDGIGGVRGLMGQNDFYPGLIHFENNNFSYTP